MRSLLLLLILLSSLPAYMTPIGPRAAKRNLAKVNAQWRSFADLTYLKQNASTGYLEGEMLIREHLLLVHRYLSDYPPADLSTTQQHNRKQLLTQLLHYANDGQYPQNHSHPERTPIFIDDQDNYCAVAYLLLISGEGALTAEINNSHRYSYMGDIAAAYPLIAWAQQMGFSLDELAWIQPAYDFKQPEVRVKDRKLLFHLGSQGMAIKDDNMSPMQYRGVGIQGGLGYHTYSNKRFSSFNLAMSYVETRSRVPEAADNFKSTQYRLDMNYRYLRHLPKIKKFGLFVGGGLSFLNAVRWNPQLDNSTLLYDIAWSVDMAAKIRKGFDVGNKYLLFEYDLSVPLMAFVMRPTYLNRINFPNPEDDLFADAFRRGTFTSWNRYFRWQSQFTLRYPIRGNNQLQVSYGWDFYHIAHDSRITTASHPITFTLLVNI